MSLQNTGGMQSRERNEDNPVRRARRHMTQTAFASLTGLRLGWVRDQEQSRGALRYNDRLLMKLMEMEPDLIPEARAAIEAEDEERRHG